MKPIKFDLPLNGTRIATLEQLEDNLTPEILEPFRSGKLAKWLRARSLDEQAGAVEALLAADVQNEAQLFKKLCEVFEGEVDEDNAREMIDEYKASVVSSDIVEEEAIVAAVEIESKTDFLELTETKQETEEIKEEKIEEKIEEKKEKYVINQNLLKMLAREKGPFYVTIVRTVLPRDHPKITKRLIMGR